jgi:hypothetical protein
MDGLKYSAEQLASLQGLTGLQTLVLSHDITAGDPQVMRELSSLQHLTTLECCAGCDDARRVPLTSTLTFEVSQLCNTVVICPPNYLSSSVNYQGLQH